MKHVADTRTNDGYKPFSERAYQLKWIEPNELMIRYAFDYMTPHDYSQEATVKY